MNRPTTPEQHDVTAFARLAEVDQTDGHHTLRKLGRVVVGFGLGYISAGVGIASVASLNPLGGALSYGLGWASRQIVKPLYRSEGSTPPERKGSLKRAGLFAGGMALTYFSTGLFGGALFNSFAHSWNVAGRALGVGLALGGGAVGSSIINRSFGALAPAEEVPTTPAPLANVAVA